MKRRVAIGLIGLLLLSATGCGGPDALMKELFAHLDTYAETIEKKESIDRQLGALSRVQTTLDKFDKLKLSAEDKEKLRNRYESDLKKRRDRLDAAWKSLVLEGGTLPPNPLEGFLK